MPTKAAAFIAGVYEHPDRQVPDRSVARIHAEVAAGALADAGLTLADVDGYFAAGDAPGFGNLSMADYLGLRCRYVDTTEMGGAAPISHIGHAALAIAAGRCRVALVTLAGRPRHGGPAPGGSGTIPDAPEYAFEQRAGMTNPAAYALAARRHMYEHGTTSEHLAAVKVTASEHAQHNPSARLPTPVTIAEVLDSGLIADPLHRLDCCVITDGGGAAVVVAPEVARDLDRHCVGILGQGEAVKHTTNGRPDLTAGGARWSGPAAFAQAGLGPADVDYASIYDSFTITVIQALEDLGFCAPGQGGPFALAGGLRAPDGPLPWNTDGGGLCNNHPGNRGGITKVIEAVRQLRGEAHPAVQVRDCEIALAHGTGGNLATRSGSSTIVLGRDDA